MLKSSLSFLTRQNKIKNTTLHTIVYRPFSKHPEYIDIISNQNPSIRKKSKKTLKIANRDILEYKRELPQKQRDREYKQFKKKIRSLENFERFKPKNERLNNLLMLDQNNQNSYFISQGTNAQIPLLNSNDKSSNLIQSEHQSISSEQRKMPIEKPSLVSGMKNLKKKFNHTKEISNTFAKGKKNQTALKDPNNLKIQLKGIPLNWNNGYIQKYFDPEMRIISDILRVHNNLGKPTNRCIITFHKEKDKEKFINEKFQDFINSNIAIEKISISTFKEKNREDKLQIYRDPKQLEIYNLPYELSYIELYEILAEYGKILELQMPMRSEKLNKGFALVLYAEQEESDLCNEKMKEFYMFGRRIRARQEFVSMDTQRKRIAVKSDHVLQNAEYDEVMIRGMLFRKYVENKDFVKNYQFEFND
jgi:hypothetical protein